MAVQFKQKCVKCKKNYVLSTARNSYVICYDCQNATHSAEITDPVYKRLFDIPEEYYKENGFLRNIKANYLKFGSLTENQAVTFKKVVAKIKEDKELMKE